MGACASKGKAMGFDPKALPKEQVQAPTPAKSEAENVPQKTDNGGENQNEAPLIDLTETKEETKESTPTQAEPVVVDSEAKVDVKVEDKVEEVVAAPEAEKVEPAAADKAEVVVVPSETTMDKAEVVAVPSETTTEKAEVVVASEVKIVKAAASLDEQVVVPQVTADKVEAVDAKEKELTVVAEDKKEEKKQDAADLSSNKEKTDDAPLIVL
ncbi:hypothetical protein ACFE04_009370 [Oxalis oulophora]